MNTARSQEITKRGLTVLGSQTNKLKVPRPTKAKRFFNQVAAAAPIVSLAPTDESQSVDGIPLKPFAQTDVPQFNADDPFTKIGQVTDKIGKMMTNYEQSAEESHYQMLQELDSNFQINNYDPKTILDESRKKVDGLITENRELKETQSNMLEDLYTWLNHEEQALHDADETMKRSAPDTLTLPNSTEEMLSILTSKTGTTQDKVSQALSLHGDIISRAYLTIHSLERKVMDQQKLIKDLETQNASLAPKKRIGKINPSQQDVKKQLEQAMNRIANQDETIKRLNERIEQLIGQAVLERSTTASANSYDEDNAAKTHDILTLELQLDKARAELSELRDQVFNLKHQVQSLESDKTFVESQNFTLVEKLELEKQRYDNLQRQFLLTINEGSAADSAVSTGRNIVSSRINELEDEVKSLQRMLDDQKQQYTDSIRKKIHQLKKEFEVREMELKKKQLASRLSGNQQAVLEALQHQHEDEIRILKRNFEEEIERLKNEGAAREKKLEEDFNLKLRELQKQMNEKMAQAGGADFSEHLKSIQKAAEDRELELKQFYNDKLEHQRNEFQKHVARLEADIIKREEEIDKMLEMVANHKVASSTEPSNMVTPAISAPPENKEEEEDKDEDDDLEKLTDQPGFSQIVKDQINDAIAKYTTRLEQRYAKKLNQQKQQIEEFWQNQVNELQDQFNAEVERVKKDDQYAIDTLKDKIASLEKQIEENKQNGPSEDEIEKIRTEFIDQIKRAQEIEAINKKLTIENELLQKAVDKGNDDFALLDLTQAFAEQTNELEKYKLALDETRAALEMAKAERNEKAKEKEKEKKRKIEFEYVYSEDFDFIEEPKDQTKELVMDLKPHHFHTYYEIQTSVEPRIQEHIKKMRRHPCVDPESLIINNREGDMIDLEISRPVQNHISYFDPAIDRPSVPVVLNGNSGERNPLFLSPSRAYVKELEPPPLPVIQFIREGKKEPVTLSQYNPEPTSIFMMSNKNFKQSRTVLFDVVPPQTIILSYAFPSSFGVPPMSKEEMEAYETARKESARESGRMFIPVVQLGVWKQDPFFVGEVKQDVVQTDVTIQVNIADLPEIVLQHLDMQPPTEIIGILGDNISPDHDVVFVPTRQMRKIKGEDSFETIPVQLLTKQGDLIDIPPIEEIDKDTHPEAAKQVAQMTINDTQALVRNLELVVSEIQTIEQERDPVKKLELQQSLGLSLDIEKDSLVSQMRERITELEQMMQRVNDEPPPNLEGEIKTIEFSPQISIEPENDKVQFTTQEIQARENNTAEEPIRSYIPVVTPGEKVDAFSVGVQFSSEFIDTATSALRTPSRSELHTAVGIQPTTPEVQANHVDMSTSAIGLTKSFSTNSLPEPEIPQIAPNPPKQQIEVLSSRSLGDRMDEVKLDEEILALRNDKQPLITFGVQAQLSNKIPGTKSIHEMSQVSTQMSFRQPLQQKNSIGMQEQITIDGQATLTQPGELSTAEAQTTPSRLLSAIDSAKRKRINLSLYTEEDGFTSEPAPPIIKMSTEEIVTMSTQTNDDLAQHEFTLSTFSQVDENPIPKKKTLLFTSTTMEATAHPSISNDSRGTSPILQERKEAAVEVKPENDRSHRKTVKMAPTASAAVRRPTFTQVTHEIANAEPVVKPPDPRIALFSKQADQISELKKELLQLQFSSPEEMPKIISLVNHTLTDVSQTIKEGQEEAVVLTGSVVNQGSNIKLGRISNQSSTAGLRIALDASCDLASEFFNKQELALDEQQEVVQRMNEAARIFIRDMDQPGGAKADAQSRFLTKVEQIANDFTKSISQMRNDGRNNQAISDALAKAQRELQLHEELIDKLEKENQRLKLGGGDNLVISQLKNVHSDLLNLLSGNTEDNKLFKSTQQAKKLIPQIAQRVKNDNQVKAAGADSIMERVSKLAVVDNPNWRDITNQVGDAISLIEENSFKKKAAALIDELNDQIKALQAENQKLQTDNIIVQRDLAIQKGKLEYQIRQLEKSLEISDEQKAVLERQINGFKDNMRAQDVDVVVQRLQGELEIATHLQQKHLESLNEATKRINALETELENTKEHANSIQKKYDMLFSQASDTQTANEALKSRTDEIVAMAEITQNKIRAIEKMHEDSLQQLDAMTEKLARQIEQNEVDKTELIKAKQRIEYLENKLLLAKAQGIKGSGEIPKIIKAYQLKMEQYMNELTKNGNENLSLRARHATDAKNIIMIQRELQRLKNELRMQKLRYESVKQEIGVLTKSVAARDETIKKLKREIERLRGLLAMQQPLKQKLQQIQKQQNDTELEYVKKKQELEKVQRQSKHITNNPAVSTYFDGLLRRHQENLAKLEKRRREMQEEDEKNRLATLRAVSHVVNLADLQIPEEMVLKMMPRPDPVQRLYLKKPYQYEEEPVIISNRSTRKVEEFPSRKNTAKNRDQNRTQSYADTLQLIGSLQGQKSPRTLREMLRNARHNKIAIPVSDIKKVHKPSKPNVLSIKPVKK